jgi:hypothetical protein
LREGPIDHGPISNADEWLESAAPIIEQRMAKYQGPILQNSISAETFTDKYNFFADFCQFFRQKMPFFSKTNVMIQYLQKLAVVCSQFFGENIYLKNLFLSSTHNENAYVVMTTALQCMNS